MAAHLHVRDLLLFVHALLWHVARADRDQTIHLCAHANRTQLPRIRHGISARGQNMCRYLRGGEAMQRAAWCPVQRPRLLHSPSPPPFITFAKTTAGLPKLHSSAGQMLPVSTHHVCIHSDDIYSPSIRRRNPTHLQGDEGGVVRHGPPVREPHGLVPRGVPRASVRRRPRLLPLPSLALLLLILLGRRRHRLPLLRQVGQPFAARTPVSSAGNAPRSSNIIRSAAF